MVNCPIYQTKDFLGVGQHYLSCYREASEWCTIKIIACIQHSDCYWCTSTRKQLGMPLLLHVVTVRDILYDEDQCL